MNIDLRKLYYEESSISISKLILKSKKNFSDKALFLDRDGVLIEDVHHINSPDKVLLCPKVSCCNNKSILYFSKNYLL